MNELGPLMKYKSSEPRMKVVLDIDDMIQQREILEYGPSEAPQSEYVVEYRRKVENWIRKLAEDHPTIQKIKKDEVLTELDLERLEKTLNTPGLFITEESLQKAFKQSKGTLVEFIKKILGLYDFPDPEKRIDDAFKTFMVEKNYLTSDQVNFLRTIETVFKKKHHIEFSDLYEPPFTNFGSKAPVPLLEKEDLEKVMQLCKGLEIEVFTKKNA
jgi:type I restriction enzyme R subunit